MDQEIERNRLVKKGTKKSNEKQLYSFLYYFYPQAPALHDLPMSIVGSKLRADPSPGMQVSLAVEVNRGRDSGE